MWYGSSLTVYAYGEDAEEHVVPVLVVVLPPVDVVVILVSLYTHMARMVKSMFYLFW